MILKAHTMLFLKNETRTSTHPIDNLVSGKVFSGHLSFTKIQKQLDWHTLLAHDGIYCSGFLWDGRMSLCSSEIKMLEKLIFFFTLCKTNFLGVCDVFIRFFDDF